MTTYMKRIKNSFVRFSIEIKLLLIWKVYNESGWYVRIQTIL